MISTHVLDMVLGTPARGLTVHLDVSEAGGLAGGRSAADTWRRLATAATSEDGRAGGLADAAGLADQTCRLSFETGAYFAARGRATFFPQIEVVFVVGEGGGRYHVPLLLSPFGYSVYRGS
jgi:5-hydroxyisourate hydrolase